MGAFTSKPAAPAFKAHQISSVDRTMLDLKNTRDRLYRYRTQLEQDNAKLLQQAQVQKNLSNKTRALGLLRLKKYKQSLLDGVEEQLLSLQQIISTIDSKQNEQQLFTVLKSGKDCLNQLHAQFNVDQVLELLGEVQESLETEREINDVLAQVPELTAEQEESAQLELQELMMDMSESIKEDENVIPVMPEAPSDQPLPTAPSNNLPEPVATEATPTSNRVALPG